MRVSVDITDPGHIAFRRLGGLNAGISAYLDGRRVSRCVTADTKLGSVTVYESDDKGGCVLNARGNRPKRQRLFGKVEIWIGRR